MKRSVIKYLVLAAGLLLSAAFYVFSGDVSEAPLWRDAAGAETESVPETGSAPEAGGAQGSPSGPAGARRGGFTEEERTEIREICLGILREYGEEHLPERLSAADPDPRLDLNSATKEELMELPGIGEAKAEAILRYRRESGDFEYIEELMNISGIKGAAFEKLKDLVRV